MELIRRLAEDDKDGVMAHKVLNLLWNLAHSDDVPVDIMDQALSAHIKILDYSCSQVDVAVLVRVFKGELEGGAFIRWMFSLILFPGPRHAEDSVDRSFHRGATNQ